MTEAKSGGGPDNFKHGRVGGEIPAQIYAAVAEILAWVGRVNRYRYDTEGNQVTP